MRKHSLRCKQTRRSPSSLISKSIQATAPSQAVFDFVAALKQLFEGTALPTISKPRGRPARVPLLALRSALVFHFMHAVGAWVDQLAGSQNGAGGGAG